MREFKWIATYMIKYNVKKNGITLQYPFFKGRRLQESKPWKNIRVYEKQKGKKYHNYIKGLAITSYNDLIPSHIDKRSSCTLGLSILEVDGRTSISRKLINFLSKGCKGSKSLAILQPKEHIQKVLVLHLEC